MRNIQVKSRSSSLPKPTIHPPSTVIAKYPLLEDEESKIQIGVIKLEDLLTTIQTKPFCFGDELTVLAEKVQDRIL